MDGLRVLVTRWALAGVLMWVGCSDDDGGTDSAMPDAGASQDGGAADAGPLPILDGDPDDPVEGAIPDLLYEPDTQRYDPETDISLDTFGVGFTLGTTVAEANAVIEEAGAEIIGGYAGVDGEVGGVLVLRADTDSAQELESLVESLEGNPAVEFAATDHLLTPMLRRPQPTEDLQEDCAEASGETRVVWSYDGVSAYLGTWGLEFIRAPQMWNLVEAIRKSEVENVRVGVIDAGFEAHEDVDFEWDGSEDDHGTSVSGIIAANWDDIGIDGVSPFVDLELMHGVAYFSTYTELFLEMADRVDVVNLSMGYRYGVSRAKGAAAHRLQQAYQARKGRLPVIVVAAGNDSDLAANERVLAREGSGIAWAGAEFGDANVANIEAIRLSSTDRSPTLANFSNVSGHFSAPGETLGMPTVGNVYCRQDGTSFAAPLVTGLVAFLMSVEPSLREASQTTIRESPVLDVLRRSAIEVEPRTSDAVDGYGALLELDRLTDSNRVLRLLTDVDDGTPDGNTRVDPQTGIVNLDEDVDGDGGRGDGNVDMSDFRRFRDWYAELLDSGLRDGPADHPKRDLNGDGDLADGPFQGRYAFGDFNGDGELAGAMNPAYLGWPFEREVTDLDVLEEVFEDPFYEASELEGLMESGDITVDLQRCLGMPAVAEVEMSIRVRSTTETLKTIRVGPSPDGNRHVLTMPINFYTIDLSTYDAAGELLDELSIDPDGILSPCEDVFVAPSCAIGADPNDGILYEATLIDPDSAIPTTGASALNDAGQVLGPNWLYTPGSGTVVLPNVSRPYYLGESGAVEYPDIMPPPGANTVSWDAISDNGVFAGFASNGPAVKLGYLYNGSTSEILADFTSITGDWAVTDVNNSGTVVGVAMGQPADLSGATPSFLTLPTGSATGQASFINNAGWIAGAVNITGVGVFPALWRGANLTVYMDDELEQFVAISDTGTLVALCLSNGCFKVSLDAETFFELETTQEVVTDDDGNRDPYNISSIIDINDAGVILASARRVGSGGTEWLRLTPIGTGRVLLRTEVIPRSDSVRYRVFVRNTGFDVLSGLQLTLNLSRPSESTIALPDECTPNMLSGGLSDHVVCVFGDAQTLAPEEEQLLTFDFRPDASGELATEIEASMLAPSGGAPDDRRVYRTNVP